MSSSMVACILFISASIAIFIPLASQLSERNSEIYLETEIKEIDSVRKVQQGS